MLVSSYQGLGQHMAVQIIMTQRSSMGMQDLSGGKLLKDQEIVTINKLSKGFNEGKAVNKLDQERELAGVVNRKATVETGKSRFESKCQQTIHWISSYLNFMHPFLVTPNLVANILHFHAISKHGYEQCGGYNTYEKL